MLYWCDFCLEHRLTVYRTLLILGFARSSSVNFQIMPLASVYSRFAFGNLRKSHRNSNNMLRLSISQIAFFGMDSRLRGNDCIFCKDILLQDVSTDYHCMYESIATEPR